MTNMDGQEVIAKLKSKQGKQSLRKFAESIGVSPAYLSDIYRGRRDPGPSVLRLLGLERKSKISYQKVKA